MMILPLRYTHIGRYFRVVAEYTLNPPTRGLNISAHLSSQLRGCCPPRRPGIKCDKSPLGDTPPPFRG